MLGLGDPPPSNPVSGPVMIDKAAHAMKEPTPFAALARFRWRALFMRKVFHCEAAYATWMHRPCHIHQYASPSIGPRFIAAGSQCRTLICKLASRWAHSPMPAAYGMYMIHHTKLVVGLSSDQQNDAKNGFPSFSRSILMEDSYCL